MFGKKEIGKNDHPLAQLSRDRNAVVDEVVRRTAFEYLESGKSEEAVTESLFWERKRLELPADPIRDALDSAFWKDIGSQLLSAGSTKEETVQFLFKKISRYHAEEIAGNFNDKVYKMATAAVPQGMGWLLQAFTWNSFKNLFVGKVDLRRKVHLNGEIPQLQALAKRGTVILLPTHFSNLDSVLVGWALYELGLPPFAYGAGLNLFTNPVFGYFMNNLGAYKVDRRKRHKLYKDTLKNFSTTILERGAHSLFFPGGGRSRAGTIEKKLKLGLLGTAIDAYVNNLITGSPNPNIYIVPCVISYHFVLEAGTLIDDFLAEQGKSRYIIDDDESSKPKVMANFLFNFMKASSSIYLNFGKALDPFGNLVDEDGISRSAAGLPVDINSYVKSGGEVKHIAQRDYEYTKLLGERVIERFHVENIALTSHFIAYAYFEYLRKKYGPVDLFPIFRLRPEETIVNYADFSAFATPLLKTLHKRYQDKKLLLEPALRSSELMNILESAERNMGLYHTLRPLKLIRSGNELNLLSEDTKLLFYYHNRMEGYGLGTL